MSILDGQPVDAATSNPSWISQNTDDTTPSKLGLGNTAPESGTAVTNTQTELNAIDSFTGNPINSLKTSLPAWTNNDVGSSSDNLKVRADAITVKFNPTTGHKHTGAAGDAPQIQSGDIANTPFRGVVEQGSTLSGITGGSTDVSAYLIGKSPSSNSTTLGVVINTPYNKVILRDGNNTEYFDGSGNIVYGRLTYAASVWALTYYSDVVGIETAYSFASASVIKWYYQELFNPLSNTNPPPVYNEFAFIPSDNATADILTATTTTQGKVQLATSAQSVGSANSGGTANATVANADHAHQGVHSVAHSGDAAIYGDVTFTGTGGTAVSEAGQNIQITSPALSTNSPQPVGSSASAGTGTASSKDDHTHVGVHSVSKSGSPQIVGDATYTGGTNITLTQVAQNIDIALSGIVSIANGGTGQSTASAAFAALSPMTTAGDIIYENATPTPARLPIGTSGQILTVVSGVPAWQTFGGGSISQNYVYAGPASGGAGAPSFRPLTVADETISTQTLTESAGATTIDWSLGNLFKLTLNANLTISFSNAISGQTIVVILTNTASNYTVTWPTIKWSGGTAPVMTGGAVSDVYTILYDGSNYYGSYVQNMS